MATYAIGDIQGCYQPLMKLLEHIQFDTSKDTLWFTGDLVNRGPQSLEVLRFVKSLGKNQITVLGNHDLHLLAVYHGKNANKQDTLHTILQAADVVELMTWLMQQPLFYYDKQSQFALVHAGVSPLWTIDAALTYSREIEDILQNKNTTISAKSYLLNMYSNTPTSWQDCLTDIDRLRVITNYCTRVRYCYHDGSMNFNYKGSVVDKPSDLIPWYELTNRRTEKDKIIFGHWASLLGRAQHPNVYAIDTGCCWGESLTALRLEDGKRFAIEC